MAYITADDTAKIRKALKVKFPKYKFTVSKSSGNHGVNVALKAGPRDLSGIIKHAIMGINEYYLDDYNEHASFFKDIVDTIKYGSDRKWYDRSDIQTDYFDTAFYIHLRIENYSCTL